MVNHSKIKNSIILVPFPFDDFSSTKVRPAICLTSKIGKYNHIIIAFISSKITEDIIESDLIIRKENSSGTGLMVDSVVRLHKLVTIPQSLVLRKLGSINPTIEREIKNKIKKLFDL